MQRRPAPSRRTEAKAAIRMNNAGRWAQGFGSVPCFPERMVYGRKTEQPGQAEGDHGIKIIAPTPFKKKIEQEKLDPDTQLLMLDADGKIITEEKTIQIPMYKPVTVFDVSQTEGRPLPQLAHDLSGNVANYDVFMEALRRSSA